jgi:hypothetical protein
MLYCALSSAHPLSNIGQAFSAEDSGGYTHLLHKTRRCGIAD